MICLPTVRNGKLAELLGAGALAIVLPSAAQAAVTVTPNAYATAEGEASQFGSTANGAAFTYQFIIAGSQLGSITPGNAITRIGFRLDSDYATISSDLNYSRYDIQIVSLAQPGAQLSTNSRECWKRLGSSMTARKVTAVTAPTPGTVMRRRQVSSRATASSSILCSTRTARARRCAR